MWMFDCFTVRNPEIRTRTQSWQIGVIFRMKSEEGGVVLSWGGKEERQQECCGNGGVQRLPVDRHQQGNTPCPSPWPPLAGPGYCRVRLGSLRMELDT